MIFSSNRYGLPPVTTSSNGQTKTVQVSQLYITAVVVDEINIVNQLPGDLFVEPAAEPAEHDARLGELPHSDRRRVSRLRLIGAPSRRRIVATLTRGDGPWPTGSNARSGWGRRSAASCASSSAAPIECARDRDGAAGRARA